MQQCIFEVRFQKEKIPRNPWKENKIHYAENEKLINLLHLQANKSKIQTQQPNNATKKAKQWMNTNETME